MKILAIETSCDETAAAIVADGAPFAVQSSVVASQEGIHARFGGVIPEIASRKHIEVISAVVREAMQRAGVSWSDLDGVAVTAAPGLMPALLVGLSFAKGLALATGLRLVGVHHLAGHLAAMALESVIRWPHLGLVVSGGHTVLYFGEASGAYRVLGETRDDAAGEAFDKVAKAMGLGYPGGREIEKLARQSLPDKGSRALQELPKTQMKGGGYDFSFSGLKTAMVRLLQNRSSATEPMDPADLAYAFQERVLEILASRLGAAIDEYRPQVVYFCGGVAANGRLRQGLLELCRARGVELQVPTMAWCTDNAAMIGAAGLWKLKKGMVADLSLAASPQAAHDFSALAREFFP